LVDPTRSEGRFIRALVPKEEYVRFGEVPVPATAGMTSPVRCAHCGKVYDLGRVEVVGRYTDCSVWNTPCCNRQVDDRGETGWKGLADYHRLPRWEPHEGSV
jgi:hypothetical protein